MNFDSRKIKLGKINFGKRKRGGSLSSLGGRSSRSWHGLGAGRILPLALAGAALIYRGVTGRWPLANLLGFNRDEQRHPATSVPHETGIKVERSIMIHKAPDEIYRFWRDLENLPRFMTQHVSVDPGTDDQRSHWKLKSLAGKTFEWDAEIINDIPNQLLAWRSLEGADLDHAGSVHFEPADGDATRVSVILEYRPPVGKLGAGVARLFGQEPSQVIDRDLQRLKQLLETGEAGEHR
jgi:uncharacterized membrane protein